MTGDAIALVQDHYESLKNKILLVTETFYDELFERTPALRKLFPSDLMKQYAHFVDATQLAVENLATFTAIDQTLRDLGAQHLRLGVQPHHYFLARDAFLIALERHSGDDWNADLEQAWRAAFGAIAAAMLRGAALETAAIADGLATSDTGEASPPNKAH